MDDDEIELPPFNAPLNDATRELLSVLSDSYAESMRELQRQRQYLHKYRREVESKINVAHAKNGPENAWKIKYSTSVAVANASRVPRGKMISASARLNEEARERIEDYSERRRAYETEQDWLTRNPSSILWYKLRADYWDEGRRNAIREKAEEARLLVAAFRETNEYRQLERDAAVAQKYASKIANEMLQEVADSLAMGLCTHMMNLCRIADDASVKLVSTLVQKPYPSQKGTYNKLLQGLLKDYAKEIGFSLEASPANPSIVCTQKVPESEPSTKFDRKFDAKLVVADLIQSMKDAVSREKLINMESSGFEQMELEPTAVPIQLPGSAGPLSLLRVLPRPLASQSLLVAGTDIGRFVIWSVPWKNGLDPGEVKKPATFYRYTPTMVAYSPRLPSSERASMTEFKECPTSMNLVVTLDSKGTVRMWSLNPTKSKKSHTNKFINGRAFVPYVPACIFIVRAPELNLPMPFDSDNARTSDRLLRPQGNVVPTKVMFHPSMNFAGRAPSLVVGTVGGDLFKLNSDFHLPAAQGAPNLFNYPFVNVEYPSLAEGIAQVAGKGKFASPGSNMVLREVFHYHKGAIVYIDVLHGLSDTIISVDRTGLLALWKYKEEFFCGSGWFRPYKTLKLDLGFFSYRPVPFEPSAASSDPPRPPAPGDQPTPPLPWSAYSVECEPPQALLRSLKVSMDGASDLFSYLSDLFCSISCGGAIASRQYLRILFWRPIILFDCSPRITMR
jgi:hypothetical protein